jgi:hypothetical protein
MVFSEYRRFPRRKLEGGAHGRLFSKHRLFEYQVDFADVSANGVGLTVYEAITVGEEYTLVSGDETIDLRLMWIRLDGEGVFRCGFLVLKPLLNLDLYLA